MKYKDFIKNNIKVILVMAVVIIFGVFGITYALKVGPFNSIALNTTTVPIDVNVTYDSATNESTITNNGNMIPIDDSLVTGPDITDPRVIKAKFIVTGVSTNPNNVIYDVSLRDAEIDCDLRTEDLKWRLYKNNSLLSEGNLSPTFDTMEGNRLVLTETQQDLTTSSDEYVFLLWISESCTGDITTCLKEQDQSKYLNRSLSTTIKIELSTKTKKSLTRKTASAGSCNYETTSIPVCNSVTYNGTSQTIATTGTNYTLKNNTGTNAGNYVVTATLNQDYKWSDGTTDDKELTCCINQKEATIIASDQEISYGSTISTDSSNYSAYNLVSSHSLESAFLNTSISEVGIGTITPSAAKIIDANGNDVTSNYKIKYTNADLTIKCLNTATAPSVSNKIYNGEKQTGVSGGSNIILSGTSSATESGSYKAYAEPEKNYCWSDYSTTKKEYTWSIGSNLLNVALVDKTVSYTGSAINIDAASITDASGNTVTGPSITYKYYDGSTCSTERSSAPKDAGNYSAKAFTSAYGNYSESESNCATIKINKLTSSLTLGSDSTTLTYGTALTASYTVTPSSGTVSCSSDSSSIATCSIDSTNKQFTITPAGVGSTTITFTVASSTNYESYTLKRTITVNCSPTATEPTVSNKTYNGSAQTGVSGGNNITKSGTTSATNAGSYSASATPSSNYCWSDGTTDTKSYSWTIAKKSASMTVSSTSLSITYGNAGSFTYTYTGDGSISCSSNSTSVATCSVDTTNKKVTVTSKGAGSATITLKGATGTNYNSISKTVSVTVNRSPTATAPTVSNKTYTGSAVTGVSGGSNVTLGGTTSATNAGTYTATATPKANYAWSDGSTSSKSYTWYIIQYLSYNLSTQYYAYTEAGYILNAVSGYITKYTSSGTQQFTSSTNPSFATVLGTYVVGTAYQYVLIASLNGSTSKDITTLYNNNKWMKVYAQLSSASSNQGVYPKAVQGCGYNGISNCGLTSMTYQGTTYYPVWVKYSG